MLYKGRKNTLQEGLEDKMIPKNIMTCESLKEQLATLSNFSSSNKREIVAVLDEIEDFIMYLKGKREVAAKLSKER
jgi:hypothetical protein